MSRPGLLSRPSSVATAAKTIVLVTGSESGVGFEIVKQLSKDQNNQILLGTHDANEGEEAVVRMGAPINVNPILLDVMSEESIEHCYLTIEQMFGKLDILVNNAAIGDQTTLEGKTLRETYDYLHSMEVTSGAVLTEKLAPLLQKSKLPKLIWLTSELGSIQRTLAGSTPVDVPFYSSSKAAVNWLVAFYSKKNASWKVNAVCAGYQATSLANVEDDEENEDAYSRYGAARAVELATEGPDGVTGTYSNDHEQIPW